MRRLFSFPWIVSCVVFGISGCELADLPGGEFCTGNSSGNYADDFRGEIGRSGSVKASVQDKGGCTEEFSFCLQREDKYYCSRCAEDEVWVITDDGDGDQHCVACSEIDKCETESCKDAVDACKNPGCIPGCRDGKLIECTNDGVNESVCEYGCKNSKKCKDPNDDCEANEIVKDGVCVCDTENHWVGESGDCVCETGYIKKGDDCVKDVRCNNNEIYDATEGTCVCDRDNHWVGEAPQCNCETGYIKNSSGVCVKDTGCNFNEIWDNTLEQCVCNASEFWEGTAGSCSCMADYLKKDNSCVKDKECSVHESFDEVLEKCVCDAKLHWTGESGNCTCETGYFKNGGSCEPVKKCNLVNEIYDPLTNTCSCNYEAHWVGSANNCTCDSAYFQNGNTCEPRKPCDLVKEIYNGSNNTCSCNTSAHWTGNAGNCQCAFGYKASGSSCVTYNVGESFNFGQYFYANGSSKTDIEWRILNKTSNQYMLISKYGLDVQKFDSSSNNWDKSYIKSWLNGTFKSAAFSSSDVSHIANSSSGMIFLISKDEADSLFSNDTDRITYASPYSVSRGALVYDSNGNLTSDNSCKSNCRGWWWLRTASTTHNNYALLVKTSGLIVTNNGDDVNSTTGLIRPALYVNY